VEVPTATVVQSWGMSLALAAVCCRSCCCCILLALVMMKLIWQVAAAAAAAAAVATASGGHCSRRDRAQHRDSLWVAAGGAAAGVQSAAYEQAQAAEYSASCAHMPRPNSSSQGSPI
jgi:hypothetical protein